MTVISKYFKMADMISSAHLLFIIWIFILGLLDECVCANSRVEVGRTEGEDVRVPGTRSRSARSVSAAIRNYKGPEYNYTYWRLNKAEGVLYGVEYYKTLKAYRDNPDREPTICFNAIEPKEGKYGYFICPEEGGRSWYKRCCGERGKQYCCKIQPADSNDILLALSPLFICIVIAACCCFCIRTECAVCSKSCNFCEECYESCCRNTSSSESSTKTDTSLPAVTEHEMQPLTKLDTEIIGDPDDMTKPDLIPDQKCHTETKGPS